MDVQVKSPMDIILHFIKDFDFPIENYFDPALNYNQLLNQLYFFSATIGQELLNPIDVSGWDGNRNWINSNTLVARWQVPQFYAGTAYEQFRYVLIDFAKSISDNSTDPEYITQLIVDHFIPAGLQTPADYERATVVFKSDYVPSNYFEDGTWSLDYNEDVVGAQVALLLAHIGQIPEFQLM